MRKTNTQLAPRANRYDYQTLFSGPTYELVRGEDFETEHVVQVLHTAARNRGLKIRTESTRDASGEIQSVLVQVVKDD